MPMLESSEANINQAAMESHDVSPERGSDRELQSLLTHNASR